MKTPIIDHELVSALKKLKLGHLVETLPERIVLADKQSMSVQDLLLLVLSDEISRRDSTSAERRAKAAGLDPTMQIERWDKTAKVTYDKRVFTELMSLRFIESHQHVIVLGPVGVGKTFLANALGHIACRHRYQVMCTRADDMLRTLRKSRLDNSRDALMVQLCTVDLLIIDDFALEPMTREESRDVYQLFVERTGRAATIITSNRDTSEWLATFDDILLAQSAVDRFKNAAFDLVVEGESYRPRLKPGVRDDDPPPVSQLGLTDRGLARCATETWVTHWPRHTGDTSCLVTGSVIADEAQGRTTRIEESQANGAEPKLLSLVVPIDDRYVLASERGVHEEQIAPPSHPSVGDDLANICSIGMLHVG